MRLIDADTFIPELEEAIVENGEMDCLDFLRVASLIEAQPTIEAIPKLPEILKKCESIYWDIENHDLPNGHVLYGGITVKEFKDVFKYLIKTANIDTSSYKVYLD